MTDIIENAGQPENTAPAAGEKKPENTPKKEKQPMTFKRLYKEWILPFGLEILALFLIVKFVLCADCAHGQHGADHCRAQRAFRAAGA